MTTPRPPRDLVEPSNQAADESTYVVFGQVAEQVERALADGREPDVEALVADHPELERPIRELVPALIALNELGQEPPEPGQPLESDEQRLGTLGDFRIVREIGRGGMGVVYEAEQISLRRRVALKVLPFAAVLAKRQLQRFKNEALAAASLDHPGIVAIYSVGCERGVHF